MTYELKAQLMRNIEMQNQKLKTELTLHEKMNESKLLNQQNRKLHEDSTLSRTNTLRLMKMFEKKAKDGNCRFNWIYLSFLCSDWQSSDPKFFFVGTDKVVIINSMIVYYLRNKL